MLGTIDDLDVFYVEFDSSLDNSPIRILLNFNGNCGVCTLDEVRKNNYYIFSCDDIEDNVINEGDDPNEVINRVLDEFIPLMDTISHCNSCGIICELIGDTCDTCHIYNIVKLPLTEDKNCPICLEPIQFVDYRETLCHHFFHNKCIANWKLTKPNCPICRRDCL
jgi:hypothetical protein